LKSFLEFQCIILHSHSELKPFMWCHSYLWCSILESNNKKLIFLSTFTIDYIVTFPCLLTKMSKLAAQDKFLDLSDYGRPLATLFAQN
jgi:hypothetical protein